MVTKTTLRILLVEDDPVDAEIIQEELRTKLGAEVNIITTEGEFANDLDKISQNPPDVIVVDVMLRWAKPSPDLKLESIPKEVREEKFYTAGLRCIDRLEAHPKTRKIPYVLYSGLNKNNFKGRVVYTKSEDMTELIEAICKVTNIQPSSRQH